MDFEEVEHLMLQARKKKKKCLRRKKKKTDDCQLIIIKIETYCLSRVTWEEVQPVINMLEVIFGMDAPPYVKSVIQRIKSKFKYELYGRTIVNTQQVVMNRNTIEAMTKVTKDMAHSVLSLLEM